MDQPTDIDIIITGEESEVKLAAFTAAPRLIRRKVKEGAYVFDDNSDFIEQIEKIISILGNCSISSDKKETTFKCNCESYACFDEDDVRRIADAIIGVSPNVEFNIDVYVSAPDGDGYTTTVYVNYTKGTLDVDVHKEYCEDENEGGWNEDDDE